MNISLFKVYMPPDMEKKLAEVLYSGYVAEGTSVKAFEERLAAFGHNDNVITTNACTSALHLALAMETKGRPGYVISTPMTCVATNVSITNLGNKIIWTDVDPTNGMITAKTLRDTWDKLSFHKRKNVKAVIYVLWGGDVGHLIDVNAFCKNIGVPLIVDAAQGLGALGIDNKPITCSSLMLGDYITHSFQAIKHITTGDGGCLFIRDLNKFQRASKLKWFGIDRNMFRTPTGEINWKADIPEIGYKFHMNNIAGCIGVAQMDDNLQTRLNLYKENALYYDVAFKGYNFIRSDKTKTSANWVYTAITIADVNKMIVDLKAAGIDSSRMHLPNNIYTGLVGETPIELSGLEMFSKMHLCIPCGWWIKNEERSYIVERIIECLAAQS